MSLFKLKPACKDYIWGGTKLKRFYGKSSLKDVVSESWELSFHKDGLTEIDGGGTLKDTVTEKELGSNLTAFTFFPAMIKLIDAAKDLSIQVHPSDEYALKNENSYGKTEMWHIVEAEKGAGIYLGFNKDVTKSQVKKAIESNEIVKLLNYYPVKAGETYFIPSGTVHAICKGCLILEIQQNSNLTYRVYDYDRADKDGNKRPLHIEKALEVMSLRKFSAKKTAGNLLGASKYFTVKKYSVSDKTFVTDGKTFNCVTCVKGGGYIDGKEIKKGDSFFVGADHGKYRITGDVKVVITSVRKYYLGIDLGGTFIKGGIVDDSGELIIDDKIPTEREKGDFAVAKNIAELCKTLLDKMQFNVSDVSGVGIGVPGLIDGDKGRVVYSNNLDWKNFDIVKETEKLTGLKVVIANDADVAALAEYKFGAGAGADDCVMITLGTGVGGGIIIDGKLYTGNRKSGAEIGHMVIEKDGEQCTCGHKGCFEAYGSASALIKRTKKAMLENKESLMWNSCDIDGVTGKTAFDYYDTDATAKKVVDEYIDYLSVGVVNVVNVLKPQRVIIGGGISAQKAIIIPRLQKMVDENSYGGILGPKCKVVSAKTGNKAGILGAAMLIAQTER